MPDTLFVNYQEPPIYAEWLNPINDFVYKGRDPNYQTTSGLVNAYIVTYPQGSLYTTPQVGDSLLLQVNIANTSAGTLTLNVNGSNIGPYPITKNGSPLAAGDLVPGTFYTFYYNGTGYSINADPASANNVRLTGDQTIDGIKTFTSSPLVPTPALNDNTTKAINSAFLRNTGNLYATPVVLTTSTTLTAADAGKLFVINSATAVTITLPLANVVTSGNSYTFYSMNTGVATIQCAGSDLVLFPVTDNKVTVRPGEDCTITSNGSNAYWPASRTSNMGQAFSFAGVIGGASGYQRLANGLLFQYGNLTSSTSAGVTVNFPIAFPSNCYSLQLTPLSTVNRGYAVIEGGVPTATSFTASLYDTANARIASTVYYFAIGT